MSDPAFAHQLQPSFGSNVVVIDPYNPEMAEIGKVQHLRMLDARQSAKKALLALGTLALPTDLHIRRAKLIAMQPRSCTIDSSCVIASDHLNLIQAPQILNPAGPKTRSTLTTSE